MEQEGLCLLCWEEREERERGREGGREGEGEREREREDKRGREIQVAFVLP